MNETADAADTFNQIGVLLEVLLFGKLFESAVDIADDRHGGNDLFVIDLQTKLERLRQNRMLGAERNQHTHFAPPSAFFCSTADT